VFLIYYLSSFYLNFIRFYFLFRIILLQLQVIEISGMNISKIESWSKKKEIWSWFKGKIWRFCTNLPGTTVPSNDMVVPSRFQGQTPTREVGMARASSGTAVRDPHTSFCCFSLPRKASSKSIFDLKPMVSCEHFTDVFLGA